MERILLRIESETWAAVEGWIRKELQYRGVDLDLPVESIFEEIKRLGIGFDCWFGPGEYPYYERSYLITSPKWGAAKVSVILDSVDFRPTGIVRYYRAPPDDPTNFVDVFRKEGS